MIQMRINALAKALEKWCANWDWYAGRDHAGQWPLTVRLAWGRRENPCQGELIFEREICLTVHGWPLRRIPDVDYWSLDIGAVDWFRRYLPHNEEVAQAANWTGRTTRLVWWQRPVSLWFYNSRRRWKPPRHTVEILSTPQARDGGWHRELFMELRNGSTIIFRGEGGEPLRSYENGPVCVAWDLVEDDSVIPPKDPVCPSCSRDITDPDFCGECGWTSQRKRNYPNPLDGSGELTGDDIEYIKKTGRQ